MVAGNHDRLYARLTAFRYGGAYLFTRGVNHSYHTDEYERVLERGRRDFIRESINRLIGHGEYAQRVFCHRAVRLGKAGAVILRQWAYSAVVADAVTT